MNLFLDKRPVSHCIPLLGSSLISLFFLLVFSASTSPLYPDYFGWDSGFFMQAGKMIVNGQTPYTDFFDMKGPFIFLLNALGQWLRPGRGGMFFIQLVFMTASVFILYKTARLFVKRFFALCSLSAALFILAVTFNRGNLTEEYSLPLTAGCVYLACRYLLNGGRFSGGIFFGAFMAFIVFMRANNAVIIVGIMFFLTACWIVDQDWKTLGRAALHCFIGFTAVCLPLILYFGFIGALPQMLKGTFGVTTAYALEGFPSSAPALRLALLRASPAVWAALCAALYAFRNDRRAGALLSFVCFLTALALCFGDRYTNYYQLLAIPVMMGLLTLGSTLKSQKVFPVKPAAAVLLLLCFAVGIQSTVAFARFTAAEYTALRRLAAGRPDLSFVHQSRAQAAVIPPHERDSVLAFQVIASWYYITGISPSFRYCAFQQRLIAIDADIDNAFISMLETNPPLWIAVTARQTGMYALTYQPMIEALQRQYHLVSETDYVALYRRIF
jgi:hypothetical protein